MKVCVFFFYSGVKINVDSNLHIEPLTIAVDLRYSITNSKWRTEEELQTAPVYSQRNKLFSWTRCQKDFYLLVHSFGTKEFRFFTFTFKSLRNNLNNLIKPSSEFYLSIGRTGWEILFRSFLIWFPENKNVLTVDSESRQNKTYVEEKEKEIVLKNKNKHYKYYFLF